PVPLDRDQAFAKYDGFLLGIGRQAGVPQLTNYGRAYSGMLGATWNGRDLDRRFLVGLEQPVWDSVAQALAAALTDSVIAEAGRYYRLLAGEVDVHATSGSDRALVSRLPDGTVELTVTAVGDSVPYLTRQLHPKETRELRVFLKGGDDTAMVRGVGGGPKIRLLGGEGNDRLVDSSGGGSLHFYDDPAGPTRTVGLSAPVNRGTWSPPSGSSP